MKTKKIIVTVVTACALLTGSLASAATAHCYKSSSNNSHRYVVNYRGQGYDVIVSGSVKQNWNGKKYVTVKKYGSRFFGHASARKVDVCKKMYGYKYAN